MTSSNLQSSNPSSPSSSIFSSDWCPPCRAANPMLEQICAEGKVKVVRIDVEECRDVARRHNISRLPTFVLYRHGMMISQSFGLQAKKRFAEWIDTSLART